MEHKHARLGWCLHRDRRQHAKCPGGVSSGQGWIICTCPHHQKER